LHNFLIVIITACLQEADVIAAVQALSPLALALLPINSVVSDKGVLITKLCAFQAGHPHVKPLHNAQGAFEVLTFS